MLNAREVIIFCAGLFAGVVLISALWCLAIVPRFEAAFANFGVDVPRPVLFAIHLSHFFMRRWWLALVLFVAGLFGLFAVLPKR